MGVSWTDEQWDDSGNAWWYPPRWLIRMVRAVTDPYAGMTDVEVLARAGEALKKRVALPPGSIEREIQRARFESAMAELDVRLLRHVIAKIRKQEQEQE